jgi:hypothetical protein
MSERRTGTRTRLWAFLFVAGIVILWFLFLRLFVEEPSGGPATAEPSAARIEQRYDPATAHRASLRSRA